MVPPPAGISQSRRRTLPGNVLSERVGSSRAHSRNYHNEEGTAGVRIERTFSLPITRYRTILASGIEPDSVPCSSMLSSLCPGLFPGVTPFRRAGGAHVVPETLGLHIPVVRIAHGTSREPSGPLTLHVPYNGCEYCRSQLEAHSFSYKPVPTTDGRWNALSCCLPAFIHIRRGGSWLFPNNKDSGNLDIPNNERSFYAVQ